MKNFILVTTVLMAAILAGHSQGCLPEGINFTTQEQIDQFQTNYPGCTEIEGDVVIEGNNISNLNGLIVLTSFNGLLTISQNPLLTSLSGLDNIISIGSLVIIRNENLENLSGLENLTSIDDYLIIGYDMFGQGNALLNNLTGLEGLVNVGGNVGIYFNDELSSLNGLNNLISIGGSFEIIKNPLTSFEGLESLTYIGGYLLIKENSELNTLAGITSLNNLENGLFVIDNDLLTSLTGIENVNPNTITDLGIYSNDVLTECDVQSICDYLISPNGIVEIFDNSSGCNSQAEVEEACLSAIEQNAAVPEILIYPNPASNFITININEGVTITEEAIIYNHLGQRALVAVPVNNIVDASELKPGIYILEVVVTENRTIREILIIE